jgi:hypothetical protein
MSLLCKSIRNKTHPGERCSYKVNAGSEWCGHHNKQKNPIRFVEVNIITHVIPEVVSKKIATQRIVSEEDRARLGVLVRKAWRRWIARRAGPLLWFRDESNNPFDFFSSDAVADIGMREFVSFVDGGKGYIMDIKSAVALIDHAATNAETPTNPFNRAPLTSIFLKRVQRHKKPTSWKMLTPVSEAQAMSLSTTDVFRSLEDLGYYTDPSWFMELGRLQLQQFYMELADIWYHRAMLTPADRSRIVPGRAFRLSIATALIMQQRALRPLLLDTCKLLVSAAPLRSDKQLGAMYVLGALSIISDGAGAAYPWLAEMFMPRATRIVGNQVIPIHGVILTY